MLPEHGDVGGQRALGGQPGGGAGDRRPVVADIAQFVQGQKPERALQPVSVVGGAAAARSSAPPRPRRVSTRPIVRSVASASRSVTVETPSCPAS
jgi:hypothetical protein